MTGAWSCRGSHGKQDFLLKAIPKICVLDLLELGDNKSLNYNSAKGSEFQVLAIVFKRKN